MKRLVNRVNLKFFCDEATGEWGVSHYETVDNYADYRSFNAFWDGIGIFHDVFEHYFENRHKYFRGKYALNVGGEMAAMGHMYYYVMEMGLGIRDMSKTSLYSFTDGMIESTASEMKEAVYYGYTKYGDTLECAVPRQKQIDCGFFENELLRYCDMTKRYSFKDHGDDERRCSLAYKKSIKAWKIKNLHRWGYRQAEKLVPNTYENRETLHRFIDFWGKFTAFNSAKDLAEAYNGIVVKLYRDGDEISWKAVLKGKYATAKDTEIISTQQLFNEYV